MTLKIKSLSSWFFSVLCLILFVNGCGSEDGSDFVAVFDSAKSVEVLGENGLQVAFWDEKESLMLFSNWAKSASTVETLGSYPDTLQTMIVKYDESNSVSFKISEVDLDVQYTMIKYNGHLMYASALSEVINE